MDDIVVEGILLLSTGWVAGVATAYTLDGIHAWHKRRATSRAFAHLLPPPQPHRPEILGEVDIRRWPVCSCGSEMVFITGADAGFATPIEWLCLSCHPLNDPGDMYTQFARAWRIPREEAKRRILAASYNY